MCALAMTVAAHTSPGRPRSILFDYARGHGWGYLASITLIVVSSRLAVWIPRWIGRFTDQLSRAQLGRHEIARYVWILLVVAGLRVVSLWAGRIFINVHGRRLVYELRGRLLSKWSTLTPTYYHRHSVGDLLSHALSDVDVLRQFSSMGVSQAVNCLSLLASAVYVMGVQMDHRLMLAGLGPLFIIPVIVRTLGPRIKAESIRYQEAVGRMAQMVEESIGGIRTIKAFGNEAVIEARFDEKLGSIVSAKMRFARLSALFGALLPLLASIGFVVVMWYGATLAVRREITLGDFVAFLLYLNLLRLPFEQLGQILNIFQRASGSLGRLAQLLNARPDVVDHPHPVPLDNARSNIDVCNLAFTYPGTDRPALRDVSFSLKSGGTLGIVGGIGGGKTTVANLLLRLYDPPAGAIRIGGVDIRCVPLRDLRRAIAYVPQNSFLFSTTLSENIGFSDRAPDANRVERAAKESAVDDSIRGFPEGFATEVGERGVRLSGGQRQRVAVARMVYKDASIRILDDSLSAVDTKTEAVILANLRRDASAELRPSTIIISHRLSTVRHADEILVLDSGRVSERGTHAELLRLNGTYAQIWAMQSGVARDTSDAWKSLATEESPVGAIVREKVELEVPEAEVESS